MKAVWRDSPDRYSWNTLHKEQRHSGADIYWRHFDFFNSIFCMATCYEKMFKNRPKRQMLPRPLMTAPLKGCFLVLESPSLKTEVWVIEDSTEDLTFSSPWWEGAPSSSLEHHALYLLPEPQHHVLQGLTLWSSTPGVTPSHSESVLCLQIVWYSIITWFFFKSMIKHFTFLNSKPF